MLMTKQWNRLFSNLEIVGDIAVLCDQSLLTTYHTCSLSAKYANSSYMSIVNASECAPALEWLIMYINKNCIELKKSATLTTNTTQ